MNDAGLEKIDAINQKLAPALIFAAVSAWFFQAFIMGSDLFWHLASGRDIWQRGGVPSTDPFSYTFGGQEWANHEWLWDVIYWGIYQFGPDAVAWFTIGIIVVVFALVYRMAYRMSGSVFASGVAVWLAAATAYWFLDIRPHVVTLLMVSIVLATLDRKWAPWLWPPLIVLWTNLHAGFVFGIGMVGLLVLVRTLQDSWNARQWVIPWWEWLSVTCCLFVWLVNPYGWKIAKFQLDYFFHDSAYRNLIEWKSPEFILDPTYYEGCFWWFTLLAVLGLFVGGRKHLYLVALAAVTLTLACKSRRFIPLFVVTSTPFVALTLLWVRDKLANRWEALHSPWAGVGASLVAAAIAGTMWSHIQLGPSLLRHWAMSDVYPEEAVKYLNALGPPKRVLNYYNWGGFIMLHAPGAQVFIDGRANTLYDEDIYLDYVTFLSGQPTPERLLRYQADVALLPADRFSRALESFHPPWKAVYRNWSVILVPPDSPWQPSELPSRDEVLKDGVQPLIDQAIREANAGHNQQAVDLLEEAIQKQPYAVRVYELESQLYANMGEFDKVEALIDRGIRDNPRQFPRLNTYKAAAYRRAGELEKALSAYEQAQNKGPFSHRANLNRLIEQLKTEIARRQRGF
jgi:tetratricopeptide (TPR) repeat protein